MKKVFARSSFLVLILMTFGFANISAQGVEEYYDSFYGYIANSNSRLVTTIYEVDNDVVCVEAVAIGYFYLGTISVCLYYDSDVVFPILGPSGDEIAKRIGGQINLGAYLELNPKLPLPSDWRLNTTGSVNPTVSQPWTYIMTSGTYLVSEKKLPDGEMLSIFKIYFKKKEGQSLSNTTFTYYNKKTIPYSYNQFTFGSAIILDGNTSKARVTNPDMFIRRSPSKIETGSAFVNGTSVTLKGLASAEGLAKVEGDGGLDWDNILSTGFIYSKNSVSLKINEYSQKIILNEMEYDFPTVTNGSFSLNDFTFNIVTLENTQGFTKINMKKTLKNLDAGETYYAYPFMTYNFQTSQTYPVLGKQVSFVPEYCTPQPVLLREEAVMELCSGSAINSSYLKSLIIEEVGFDYLFFEDANCTIAFTTDIITDYSANASHTFYAIAKNIEAGCTTDIEDALEITITVNPVPEITATSEKEFYLKVNEPFYLFVNADYAVAYQWYFNGAPIEGATQSFYSGNFTLSKEGIYAVSISNECATLFVEFELHNVLGIIIPGEVKDYKISVYPNPVRRDAKLFILLELPNNELPDATAQLFDIEGKKVDEYRLTNNTTEIKQHLPEGTYILKVNTKSGKELVTKVMVQ